MKLVFHPEAQAELLAAVDYYEAVTKGLGYDFSLEIADALNRITIFPKAWPVIEKPIRRALVKRFPYGVLYMENSEHIAIIAVMHLHRAPDYWKNRT